MPEYLLPHSKFIVEKVKNVVPQNTIALVADSSFPDCCIDIVSARHKDNMYIIKVGGVCSSYLKSISGIIVLPIKYKMDRFFPELNNSFDEKIDCGYYKWVGIAERCENNFKTYSESIFGKDRLIYNIFAENADLSQMGKGLVIVTDQSLNEDICLMSRIEADYVFLDFEKKTKKIVDSTRERSKRYILYFFHLSDFILDGQFCKSFQKTDH